MERDVVSVGTAAELLGMRIREVYDLVFTRQLKSVEVPSGRGLVPRSAIDDWKNQQTPAAI